MREGKRGRESGRGGGKWKGERVFIGVALLGHNIMSLRAPFEGDGMDIAESSREETAHLPSGLLLRLQLLSAPQQL